MLLPSGEAQNYLNIRKERSRLRDRSTACPEEGITRELCQIHKGPYAYGLSSRYVSGIDDENPDSPHLPELEFDQPVIQSDMQQPNSTIKQLALIGASTWALLKKDMAIICEC